MTFQGVRAVFISFDSLGAAVVDVVVGRVDGEDGG
jgi:hypothetical protein